MDHGGPPNAALLGDRYALRAKLGVGGAGVVWRADDLVLDRTVAVKLLHPEVAQDPRTRARFLSEASSAAQLTHPNVVVVYDIGREGGRDYLVMEHVDGVPLDRLLTGEPFGSDAVASLGRQLAAALGAAHANRLVHRDVKPANVLVTVDGVAKIADFGIAQALGDAAARLTTPGHVMGTARYLAPEQLRDAPVDARSDVYALGLVLHEALTGTPPFGTGTAVEIAMRRLADEPRRVDHLAREVPADLAEAIATATRIDPDERFADGERFAAALAPLVPANDGEALARLVVDVRSAAEDATQAREDLPTTEQPTTAMAAALVGRAGDDAWTDPGEDRISGAASDDAGSTRDLPTGVTGGASAGGPPAHAPDPRHRRRWPFVLGGVLAFVGVAVGVAIVLGPFEDAASEAPESAGVAPPTEEVDEEPDEPDEPQPLARVSAGDHDPFGSGEEHGDRVGEAIDGDSDTAWRTSQYRGDPAFGGLKPGVGVWVELEDVAEITEVTVRTPTPGAAFTVYVGEGPPDGGADPDDWGEPIGEVSDAAAEEVIATDQAVDGDVVLVWLTSLPPDGGRFRAFISDVEAAGR